MTSSLCRIGPNNPLVLPVKHVSDLVRVGPIAASFARLFGAGIEVITIVHPDDDLTSAVAELVGVADSLSFDEHIDISVEVITDDQVANRILCRCVHQVVCMATSASPFHDDHYVGSIAASLLAESSQPVILIGPQVHSAPNVANVSVAISSDPDSHRVLPLSHLLADSFELPLRRIEIDEPSGTTYTTRYSSPSSGLPASIVASPGAEPVSHRSVAARLADRVGDDLLAIATHARRGLSWIADGSVAFDMIAVATAPVVAIGPKYVALEGQFPQFPDEHCQQDEPGTYLRLASASAIGALHEFGDWALEHPGERASCVRYDAKSPQLVLH